MDVLFLGVDAGGTKTHALLVDERGAIVGRGVGGNGNHQTAFEAAEIHIEHACNEALREAGVGRDDVAFAFFGLSGADREPDYRILRPMIARLGYERHAIACDTMIGMRAGTTRSYGAVLISGTGFNAAARNKQGDELQYGGFGYLFGDGHGSGSDLAIHAFRTAIRSHEGRERPSLLERLVPETMGYRSVEDMYDAALYEGVRPPAELAKLVFAAAAQGDEAAIDILEREGREHGNALNALLRRLGMERETFDVVLTGSVLSSGQSTHMIDAIRIAVQEAAPGASIVRLFSPPVIGAVMSAMEHGGLTVDRSIDEALRRTQFN